MSLKTTFIKRLLLPATLLLLVMVWFFSRLTETVIVDLTSGFSHPLEGWDHLVTMLAVGVWAAQLRGKAIWLLPLTFVSVMSLGGISGAAKYLAVPSAEVLILLSCLVFSVLIIRKIRFDTKINVLIVAFFAFFHGYAHGQEISASASLISYTLGFMVATLLLHGAGILVAKLLLIAITFFIAQILHAAPVESEKTIAVNPVITYTIAFEQQENQRLLVEKPPLINSPQWLNFKQILHFYKPPTQNWLSFDVIKTGIQHLTNGVGLTSPPTRTYFVFAALLLVFIVSQFFCYVFYPKQRHDYSTYLACCSKKSLKSHALSLTLSRLFIFNFYTPILPFLFWRHALARPKFTRIIMKTHLSKNLHLLFALSILLLPNFAHAHSIAFTAIDWNSGFLHPLQGLDHIIAMLAVGFWAAQLRGQSVWLLPLTFVSVMSLGGLIGMTNIEIPSAELIILSSGFVLSILAIKKVRFDTKINMLIVAFFALFHGYAHGAEITDSANFLSYSLGFIVATSLLHIAGIMTAQCVELAMKLKWWVVQ